MVTLAIIGWLVYITFFIVLALLAGNSDSDPFDYLEISLFVGFMAGLLIVMPISLGLHYDIFGTIDDNEGLSLFKISGYVALALSSIGFIILFFFRSRKTHEAGQDRVVSQASKNLYSNITATHLIELVAAVVGLIASILAIISFYQAQ